MIGLVSTSCHDCLEDDGSPKAGDYNDDYRAEAAVPPARDDLAMLDIVVHREEVRRSLLWHRMLDDGDAMVGAADFSTPV
jgi:hypothetical protein